MNLCTSRIPALLGFVMKRLIALMFCIALTTGCASVRSILPGAEGTAGDQMISQAKETKSLGKNWNEGQKLVEKGNKLLSKSESLARESRDAKAEAEGMIARGNALIDNSEEGYQMAFGDSALERR